MKKKRERTTIFIEPGLKQRFVAAATAEDKTISEYIHTVLEMWAEAKFKSLAPKSAGVVLHESRRTYPTEPAPSPSNGNGKWKNQYASEDEVLASLDDVLVPKDEL